MAASSSPSSAEPAPAPRTHTFTGFLIGGGTQPKPQPFRAASFAAGGPPTVIETDLDGQTYHASLPLTVDQLAGAALYFNRSSVGLRLAAAVEPLINGVDLHLRPRTTALDPIETLLPALRTYLERKAGALELEPVGLESGLIKNEQITAQSEYNSTDHGKYQGRLNSGVHGWCSASGGAGTQWWQVDLGSVMTIGAVAVQGWRAGVHWPTAVRIETSTTTDGQFKHTFSFSNPARSHDEIITHRLEPHSARVVRITPTSMNTGPYNIGRFEVYRVLPEHQLLEAIKHL